jgi:hypothetical protein
LHPRAPEQIENGTGKISKPGTSLQNRTKGIDLNIQREVSQMLLPRYRIFLEQLLGVQFITFSDVRRIISQEPATDSILSHIHPIQSLHNQFSLRLLFTVRSAGSYSSADENFSLLGKKCYVNW